MIRLISDKRRAARRALAGAFLSLAALASTSAAGAPPAPSETAVPIKVPETLDGLDCAAMTIDLKQASDASLTPGQFDPAIAFKAYANAETAKKIALSMKADPDGLCRYRDANRALPASSGHRVIFMGDSITENWQWATPDLFTGDVINRGISGQRTGQMLARFRQDVIDLKPQVVHIMAGTNDIGGPTGIILTRDNIMSMVDLARSHGISVVLGAITPSTGFVMTPRLKPAPHIAALNTWLKSYAASLHIPFIDYHTPLADAGQSLRADLGNEGLHPNRNGYAVMTPRARAAIDNALKAKRK